MFGRGAMAELSRVIAATVAALAASAVILFTLASAVAESIDSTLVGAHATPTASAASRGSWRAEAEQGARIPAPTGGAIARAPQEVPDQGPTLQEQRRSAAQEVAKRGPTLHEQRSSAAHTRPPPLPLAAAYRAHLEYMRRHPGTGPDATEAHRQTWLSEARGTGAAGRASRDRELEKMLRSAGWRQDDSPAGLQVRGPPPHNFFFTRSAADGCPPHSTENSPSRLDPVYV